MCFAGTLNRFSTLCAALSHCGGSEPGPVAGPWFCVLASLLASSPCGCARVSQIHPPSLCQLQNCAHYRVRPSTERGSLGRGMGLFSACCIPPEQSLCPLFTGVPISYNPIPLLCQEQALQSAVCNPAAGTRGAEGVLHVHQAGVLLRLCSAIPQPLYLDNQAFFLCFCWPLVEARQMKRKIEKIRIWVVGGQ